VETAFSQATARGLVPGGVVHVRHRGQVLLNAAHGSTLTYTRATERSSDPRPARADTLYDFASLTKLFTTSAVLRLVEDGRLELDDSVAHHLSAFGVNGKDAVTIRQLLTHTGGLPALLRLWDLEPTPETRLQRALQAPLTDPPGTRFRYSDLGPIALGAVVEKATGTSLDRAINELVMRPLGLQDTRFRPAPQLKQRVAPTEDESSLGRGLVWGEVHDENAWSLGGVAGHAGLFGTAEELGILGQAFLDSGTHAGTQWLRPDTVAEMTRNQIGKLGWRGLGWELNAGFYMGRLAAEHTFGHTGFTGTSLVVDPEHQLVVVLLTNRVHPTREGPSINPLRQAVANAALAVAR
jgi:CubicO group peptidase (beta-lactamase class C family)